MIDAHVDMPGSDRVPQENAIDADDSSDDDSGDSVSEMLLVPEDVSAINVMYQALTDCQVCVIIVKYKNCPVHLDLMKNMFELHKNFKLFFCNTTISYILNKV